MILHALRHRIKPALKVLTGKYLRLPKLIRSLNIDSLNIDIHNYLTCSDRIPSKTGKASAPNAPLLPPAHSGSHSEMQGGYTRARQPVGAV